MLKKMIVKTDGVNLIGRIKSKNPAHFGVRGARSEKSKKFDEFYYEAQYNNISCKNIPNYIQERFWDTADDIIDDTIDEVEFEELYKNFQNRLHKRLQTYKEKILMNEWTYFATFTYDDKKETARSFEKRLKTVFNNFAKRHGWRVIGGWENGELGGRSHFHAFIYVPEGQMVGELYSMSRWSFKKRRMEYYTDNSYFRERFGMSDWIKITKEDLVQGGLVSYLVKYVCKSGRRLFYSRGIPNEIEMDVDTDTEVLLSYYHYGCRFILTGIKNAVKGLQEMFDVSDIPEEDIVMFDEGVGGFCEDQYKLVRLYS